jgi:hypothetical protein
MHGHCLGHLLGLLVLMSFACVDTKTLTRSKAKELIESHPEFAKDDTVRIQFDRIVRAQLIVNRGGFDWRLTRNGQRVFRAVNPLAGVADPRQPAPG